MTDEQIQEAAETAFRNLSTSMNNPPMFWWVEGFKAGVKYLDKQGERVIEFLAEQYEASKNSRVDSEMDEQA